MSLAIVLLLDQGAIVFTDSRSTASDLSGSKTGVKKTAILTCNGGHAIVAFTGDGEINNKLTVDILAESADRSANSGALPATLVEGLRTAFATDVANYAWENQADKEAYLREAKVVVHILTAPNKHCIWLVTPLDAENYPFRDGANESFSGVRKVDCFTGTYRRWDLEAVRALLPNCIDELCSNERTCGYPVDVTMWKLAGVPETARCADLNALKAHLAALVL